MKIVTIVGARPQFIKSAAISREIHKNKKIQEIIVHTGQHFDNKMSDIFFDALKIYKPDYFLNINNLSHGAMTGQMLEKIEEILKKEKPDIVIVYGDTNTTLAGALAAKKLHIKVAHVEAGLRSYNMRMPEEINRILTDRISDILFCPTNKAVINLRKEGFEHFGCQIIKCGDVMLDLAKHHLNFARKPSFVVPKKYILATIHRAENTDNIDKLQSIFNSLNRISKEIDIVLPIHPRTKQAIVKNNIHIDFALFEPVGYLEMLYLLKNCKLVMTDSGGLQKEAFFFKKPCVTLRAETEWVELVENGFNIIAGCDAVKVYDSYIKMSNKEFDFNVNLYGDGNAAKVIVDNLATIEKK